MSYLYNVLKNSVIGTYIRKNKTNKRLLNEARIGRAVERKYGPLPKDERQAIVNDILDMARKYRFSSDEYFYYHFRDKSEEERRTFISDANRVEACIRMNKTKNTDIFSNKGQTARVFSKYYKRDFCEVRSLSDLNKLIAFTQKHKKFIVKPIDGSCGFGVQIVENDWNEANLKDLISQYCQKKKSGFLAEELIAQDKGLSQFNPSSVNTVRVATVRFDDGAEVIAAVLRTGRNGSIVDNGGAGGVFGTIDVETGKIDALSDMYGNAYLRHPDTDIEMIGFVIPRWQELIELVKELATVVPDNRYTGWDMALSENGWVVVEANGWGQFAWQIARQKGFLAETEAILERLGLPKLKKLSI